MALTSTLLDFILNLLRDSDSAAQFRDDPDAAEIRELIRKERGS